jgi:hypothetical protein
VRCAAAKIRRNPEDVLPLHASSVGRSEIVGDENVWLT